ncbi:MAG: GTP cyclohydrolase I FolE2 [Alcanivoracaceae bacterium]|nr:GTP cyclohydrolase I FolE2 [Alcanivoracaceae bacterium]
MLDKTRQNFCTLPDVAADVKAKVAGTLQWVGMSEIEMPLRINADTDMPATIARVRAEVSLDDKSLRGIHMSRLYLACDEVFSHESIDFVSLAQLTQTFLDTHKGISQNALVEVDFDALIRRKALVSDNSGWRSYPVTLLMVREVSEIKHIELDFSVTYSSTCPCSAALARSLIQQNFKDSFSANNLDYEKVMQWIGSEQGINATPHAQRSTAHIRTILKTDCTKIPLKKYIDIVETALQTVVQAAVKREDEQEFARLNGQNLLFCEDAARRIKHVLGQQTELDGFWLRVHHHESLHPHDATAEASSD